MAVFQKAIFPIFQKRNLSYFNPTGDTSAKCVLNGSEQLTFYDPCCATRQALSKTCSFFLAFKTLPVSCRAFQRAAVCSACRGGACAPGLGCRSDPETGQGVFKGSPLHCNHDYGHFSLYF